MGCCIAEHSKRLFASEHQLTFPPFMRPYVLLRIVLFHGVYITRQRDGNYQIVFVRKLAK